MGVNGSLRPPAGGFGVGPPACLAERLQRRLRAAFHRTVDPCRHDEAVRRKTRRTEIAGGFRDAGANAATVPTSAGTGPNRRPIILEFRAIFGSARGPGASHRRTSTRLRTDATVAWAVLCRRQIVDSSGQN